MAATANKLFRKPFCFVTSSGKTVRQETLDQYSVQKSKGLQQIDPFAGFYKELETVEPLYNPYALAQLLEMNTYHNRCCQTVSRDTAGLGWDLKSTVADPSPASKKLKQNIIDAFADMPMNILEVLNRACTDWESVSYGAMEIVRANYDVEGDFAALVHIPSPDIRVHRSGNKYVQIVLGKKRWFKRAGLTDIDVDMNTGTEYPAGSLPIEQRATEMIFWTNYSPRSSFYGLPSIIPAIGVIKGDLSRRDYNVSFLENYGVPIFACAITGNFDPGEPVDDDGNPDPAGKTVLEREIEGHFEEISRNPHSVLILSLPSVADAEGDVKIEFQPLAKESREASFRLYRLDNRDEVIAAHGVPLNRLGINEIGALSGSTASISTEIYKTSVIGPRQEALETLINRAIIWGIFEAYDWKFTLDPIDTTDETHDVEIAKSLFDIAVLTPNDLIRNFGQRFGAKISDHPAMDAHYIANTAVDYIPAVADHPSETAALAVKTLVDAGVPLEHAMQLLGYDESIISAITTEAQAQEDKAAAEAAATTTAQDAQTQGALDTPSVDPAAQDSSSNLIPKK